MSAAGTDSIVTATARKYLQLQMAGHVGPITFGKLLEHFDSIDDVLSASQADLQQVEGVGPGTAKEIHASRHTDGVEREIARARDCGLHIVCKDDPGYPLPLLNMADPPICLYVRGEWARADTLAIAIVGTRRCSHYGREQALRFAELLGRAGFTVVSGLARGIDGHAHEGALRAGGRTIAVLGNGLSSIYPQEHEELAARIAANGALISEFPVDAAPEAHNFPRRNRLVAGLCLGAIIVEAGLRSGALITGRFAMEYNREVFAVPGRIDRPELTAGVNGLIRDGGAKLITCLDDVLDELGDVGLLMRTDGGSESHVAQVVDGSTALPALSADEQAIVDALGKSDADSDAISEWTGLDVGRVTSILTSLQLKSVVERLPGSRFSLRRSSVAKSR